MPTTKKQGEITVNQKTLCFDPAAQSGCTNARTPRCACGCQNNTWRTPRAAGCGCGSNTWRTPRAADCGCNNTWRNPRTAGCGCNQNQQNGTPARADTVWKQKNSCGCGQGITPLRAARQSDALCDGVASGASLLSDKSLAMVYSPYQKFESLYDPCQGLQRGTVFCQLDKPFYGAGRGY